MNEHFKPYPIDDEKWNGEIPNCNGSQWRLKDGTTLTGKRYDCWFGGAETVTVDGVEILGRGEIKVDDTRFILQNLYNPVIRITNIPKNVYLLSDQHSPAMIGEYIKRAMDKEPFQSHVGQLFLNRVPEALNYSFDRPIPLTLESLKHLQVGTVLWCDYREIVPGKDVCFLPMSPVEFCGLGNETFEDTSVPEPVIYFSDGMDYQDTYAEDMILWTGKPTEKQRRALDLKAYRRAVGG